jgi:hypothetical protein
MVRPFGTALIRLRTKPIVAFALLVAASLAVAVWSAGAGSAVAEARGSDRVIAPESTCGDVPVFSEPGRAVKAMVCMTNFARAAKGLPRYRVKRDLARSADRKVADILRCDAFSHSACGRPFSYWITRNYLDGHGCWSAGENIAWGTGPYAGVRSIFRAWMNSPPHRGAILSPDYRDLGIGLGTGRLDGRSGAAVWVQHFGRLC